MWSVATGLLLREYRLSHPQRAITSIQPHFSPSTYWKFMSLNFSFFLAPSSDPFAYKRCSNDPNNFYPPPPIGFVYHHSSFDELSSAKSNRNFRQPNRNINFVHPERAQQEYKWPKVIPKSPSSFSMNSFRLQREPPFTSQCSNHNPIDEFDLDKIEHDCRKSNTTLFKEKAKSKDFGTAV